MSTIAHRDSVIRIGRQDLSFFRAREPFRLLSRELDDRALVVRYHWIRSGRDQPRAASFNATYAKEYREWRGDGHSGTFKFTRGDFNAIISSAHAEFSEKLDAELLSTNGKPGNVVQYEVPSRLLSSWSVLHSMLFLLLVLALLFFERRMSNCTLSDPVGTHPTPGFFASRSSASTNPSISRRQQFRQTETFFFGTDSPNEFVPPKSKNKTIRNQFEQKQRE